MKRIAVFAIVLFLQAAIPCVSRADLIDILVPAYANPCCDGGPNMWSSLIATAGDTNRNFGLHAIFNPGSGPGTSREPNYLTESGTGPLADFRAAGGITHGYIPTGYGTRDINAVKADVDAYLTGHYAGYVDGIFFDEMSNDLANVGYYQDLHAYVQSLQPGAKTFGNPGTIFVNNPSGQTTYTATDYMNSLDTIMTFESSANEYLNNYTSFGYAEGLDRLKIAHVVHSQSTWEDSLLDLASNRGAGYLYVTDDIYSVSTDNPYDTLASYWPAFTAGVQAHNFAAVPEPSAMALIFVSGIAGIAIRRRRN
ncbi:MAG: spherulation-specific family 4 protein [Pirellulaceae bacterium]